MTTLLDKTLKRELSIDGQSYTLTLSPAGLTIVPKGRRKGVQLDWRAMISGDAALATALNASLGQLAVGRVPAAATQRDPVSRPKPSVRAKNRRRS